jgi:hypothetical protein
MPGGASLTSDHILQTIRCPVKSRLPWDLAGLAAQAFVVVGDHNGHVGLGVKCAKEVRLS